MTVEIELKFIAAPAAVAALPAKVSSLKSQHSAPQHLTNIYYETPDNTVRGMDMGLRIRGFDGRYEMTIKTAGKAMGGLHQRPEYNVELEEPTLDLARFPAEIWPEGCDVMALQGELQPLFQTDFMREKWLVTFQQSEIEIALDQGSVKAGELSEPLCEIELELKTGNTDDLLALAAWLGEEGGLRQGGLSKAARGYHLAKGNEPRKIRPIPVWTPPAKATVEQGMAGVLELALGHWQYHEELWLRGDKQARHAVIEALVMVRQALAIFGGLVPRKATSDLRNLFNDLEPQIADPAVEGQTLCFSPAYLKCKLALTSYLATAGWNAHVDAKSRQKLDGSFKRFADIMLGRTAADIKEAFSRPLTDEGYRDQLPRLNRQIIALHLLAGAYPQSAWQGYIENWQALQQSIVQQQQAWLEAARKHAVQQPAFWLNGTPTKNA
ncbi:inorganic triphosphatase [Nissabacter sp. SGAir0207]|uniref:CYTH domain-containing protein n=1 Tax=Nissabacter sp. SGAir0207 TaxID=2126321 RepID=UPI0010CD006C|nr:inorganic triphosphatase [Nissabacter sp. SGAir0207]QCR35011.1 inorganic triphosphatase [Nissabacter sp. SGAir0207]